MSTQAALPFDPPRSLVDQAFDAYMETPHARAIEAEVIARARRLKACGWHSYGIAAIFEAIRFDRGLALGPSPDEWKCNNSHRAGLARRIMREHSDLAGFFSTREQTGRTWRPRRNTR